MEFVVLKTMDKEGSRPINEISPKKTKFALNVFLVHYTSNKLKSIN